jgi:lysophospholipase L1-like esterase
MPESMGIPPALAIPAVALGLLTAPMTASFGFATQQGHGFGVATQQTRTHPPATGTNSAASSSWHVGFYSANAVGPAPMTSPTLCVFHSRIAASGSQLRLEFADSAPISNTSSFHIAGAYVTVRSNTGLVSFHGGKTATVAAHKSVLSDPISLPVHANDDLALVIRVDHGDQPQALVGVDKNTCDPAFGGATGSPIRWLQSVQVYGPTERVVGTVGDSITEGLGMTPGSHARWTDLLDAAGDDVVNGGVTASNLSGMGPLGSADGLHRLPAVLAEPGLTDVVIAMGTNDAGAGHSANQILLDIQQAIATAAAKHVRVSIATIIPRGGSAFWTNAMENVRSQVNGTLRSWAARHQITLIDLDLAVRDPRNHQQIAPAYGQADHAHPSAAGHRVLAQTTAKVLGIAPPR